MSTMIYTKATKAKLKAVASIVDAVNAMGYNVFEFDGIIYCENCGTPSIMDLPGVTKEIPWNVREAAVKAMLVEVGFKLA